MNNRDSSRIWQGISRVVLALVAAILGILLWQIYKLHMLPGKYFLLLCGGCLVITGLLCLLLFRKSRVLRILGYVLALGLLAGCFVGSQAVGRVQNTVSSITAPMKVSVVLEIYVRADDPAEYLQDTAGYVFALPEDIDDQDIAPVVEELEELLQEDPEFVRLANTVAQMDALLKGQVDAVVLNSAYLTILEGMEEYADYADNVRLLHKKVIEKEIPQTKPNLQKPNRPGKTEEKEEKTGFLCYVSGVDNRYSIHVNGRSDVNILVAVNPVTHQILMVNTPRDYYVINPASTYDALDKLTHCGVYGVENSMEALGILYGHYPEYYARINFTGLETLVDAIGGVTVYSDMAFTAHGGTYIQKGANYLNGREALNYARTRKTVGGDSVRGKNQMKLISAIVNQLSASTLLQNYEEILKSLEGMFVTSMPAEQIGSLMQTQIEEMPNWEIFTFAVTGNGASDKCWAAGNQYLYVTYPHEDVVAYAAELMGKILVGEKLTQEDMTMPK